MAKQVQIRRGTSAEIAAFTGALGEITYNTTTKTLQTHDGATAGGKDIGAGDAAFAVAASDETTALTTGAKKIEFSFPYAMSLVDVYATVVTPTSGAFLADVNINAETSPDELATIMSTDKLSIDSGEVTTKSAATQPALTTTTIPQYARGSIDIDTADGASTGLKVYFIGTRT